MANHTEIVIGAAEVYLAPVGETYPVIDAAPAGNWQKLGSNGDDNLGEDGVRILHEQTVQMSRTLGSTGPIKAARPSERLTVSGVLVDFALEEVADILNDPTVADTAAGAGTAGFREITLRQGPTVSEFALLVRGENLSPYGETWNVQYEIPRVVCISSPEVIFHKGNPIGLAFEYEALEDESAATDAERFGGLVVQDADAV